MAGARAKDDRPQLPAAVAQTRDSIPGANEDETETSEAAKALLKQQVQALTAEVEEVLHFLAIHCKLVSFLLYGLLYLQLALYFMKEWAHITPA